MDPLQEKLAKTKLKKMQTKITFDLDLVKHLQKEVIKLSKSVVRLTAEVEELSTDIGDEEDGADGSLYSGESDEIPKGGGPNVCYVKLGLARYRRQLRELVGEVVEQIDERKRSILQLLTAAEARTEELVKARADFEAAQLKLKLKLKKEQEQEQEQEQEKALKKKMKEEEAEESTIVYSKERLLALGKDVASSSLPPPPISLEVKEKFPELFRTTIRRRSLQSAVSAAGLNSPPED